jgi:HAD superfamily phosphatase (TIGR01668 family)
MLRLLLADAVFGSVDDIDPDVLARRGIKLVLADLDNTLAPYNESMPPKRARIWKERLRKRGVELFILSNSRKPNRAKVFSAALGVPFLNRAGKPRRAGFYEAMNRMGRSAAQTAMVGDQIFTDIMGAKRAGVTALLVRPIRLAGNPGRYLRYAAELPFRLLAKERRL